MKISKNRREFLKLSDSMLAAYMIMPRWNFKKVSNIGVQLYTLRKEMTTDAIGTLKLLAKMGYKELESARSAKGNYYGLQPREIKKITSDLGMTLRSGHVHYDDTFQQSIDNAAEAGQEYLICSSMPTNGQTVSNYRSVADAFSKAGEQCKKSNLKFGYHNHEYEFEKDNGTVLYDVLLDNTDPSLVHMELDLGWVVAAGSDPIVYFKKYPGRFPLWHLKDMDLVKRHSTEFGKGQVAILQLLQQAKQSGMKHFFVEQEEYSGTPAESLQYNYDYLQKLDV